MADQQGIDGGLRELALFAGAGGGILGGKLLGWRTVCAVEINPYAASVLVARQNDGILPPFPARTSQPQEKASASQANVPASGKKWPGLLAKYDHATSSWKTAQCSLIEGLEPSLETWPRSGTMRSGVCYQRPPLAHPICENVSGYAPDNKTFFQTLNTKGLDGGSNSRAALKKRNIFPTLKARDYKQSGKSRMDRTGTSQGDDLPLVVGGRLNPTWAEWFMGFPLGWTGLSPLEMHNYRSWLQQHGQNYSSD